MESVWQTQARGREYPSFSGQRKTEILVIGGGMAGILCARRLSEAGRRVILVEAGRIGSGITAKTTAVLTAQHDMLYQDMAARFGMETAENYLHGNLDAVEQYRSLAKDIPCDFEDMPSIQFSASDMGKLRAEAEFLRRLGFSPTFQTYVPLPVQAAAAVVYPHMGQFHPLKFLYGAAKDLEIYENSQVLSLKGTTAQLPGGTIRAEQVVVATHFPFLNRRGMYFMKLYQSRSCVLALENAPDPGATLAELEGNGVYFRRWGQLLLLGGGDHRTGTKSGGFAFLRRYAAMHFPESRERFAWANQDCMSLDGLPYVGAYSPGLPGVYVATGFNAWGMTNSMVAANVLTDLIAGKRTALSNALRPDRPMAAGPLGRNLLATLGDYLIPTTRRCPHMGCALRWNPREHSWDCPCHGSRFTKNGALLDTPAQRDAKL